MNDNSPDQKVWDVKKITIFLLILVLVGAALAYGFKDQRFLAEDQVKGVQTEDRGAESQPEPPSFDNLQTNFQEKFDEIRENAESINVVEVASSSPQIQKVINDIKSLQNYPRNQAKEACFNICEGL